MKKEVKELIARLISEDRLHVLDLLLEEQEQQEVFQLPLAA